MSTMLAETRLDEATAVAEAPRRKRKCVVIIGGGFAASFCAVAVAVVSRSASGTTRVTRPSSAARAAVKGSPSKYNSAARR